ncbi:hypothetical protein CBR_g39547 [Chara braunii]|uniref:F-box domain-containing protein n=1 Tax=Chara braunii TaxID=69332 RepID=A0A388LRY7_CHABU|nr:hypothetical protein CBR_g39547 [Chara braunii]|eukprot:GBG85084.1 hypothetical protein CBR_g39547 [Chara braunii]
MGSLAIQLINQSIIEASVFLDRSAKTAACPAGDEETQPLSDTCITDLPEVLISEVLGKLDTARDVCRTATVCSMFASAVRSNLTWQRLLPRGCRLLCQLHAPSSFASSSSSSSSSPSSSSPLFSSGSCADTTGAEAESLRTCYRHLLRGFPDSNSPHIYYQLDESTGALRTTVSVMAMSVIWGNDLRYWMKVPLERSVFKEGMQSLNVCWFDVKGTVTCALPRGKYMCAWRLSQGREYWFHPRTEVTVSIEGVPVIQRQIRTGRRDIAHYPDWSELPVAIIEVPPRAEGEGEGEGEAEAEAQLEAEDRLSSVAVNFRLFCFDGGAKQGMIVDGFVIRSALEDDLEDGGAFGWIGLGLSSNSKLEGMMQQLMRKKRRKSFWRKSSAGGGGLHGGGGGLHGGRGGLHGGGGGLHGGGGGLHGVGGGLHGGGVGIRVGSPAFRCLGSESTTVLSKDVPRPPSSAPMEFGGRSGAICAMEGDDYDVPDDVEGDGEPPASPPPPPERGGGGCWTSRRFWAGEQGGGRQKRIVVQTLRRRTAAGMYGTTPSISHSDPLQAGSGAVLGRLPIELLKDEKDENEGVDVVWILRSVWRRKRGGDTGTASNAVNAGKICLRGTNIVL